MTTFWHLPGEWPTGNQRGLDTSSRRRMKMLLPLPLKFSIKGRKETNDFNEENGETFFLLSGTMAGSPRAVSTASRYSHQQQLYSLLFWTCPQFLLSVIRMLSCWCHFFHYPQPLLYFTLFSELLGMFSLMKMESLEICSCWILLNFLQLLMVLISQF